MVKKTRLKTVSQTDLSPASYVDREAVVGRGVTIGPCTIVHPHVHLGDRARIGAFCEIGHRPKRETDPTSQIVQMHRSAAGREATFIGEGALIRSHSVVYSSVRLGSYVRTGHFVTIREQCDIAENTVIGTGTVIDGFASVGKGTQIQSMNFIGPTVKIGEFAFISPNCSFLDNKQMIFGRGLKGGIVGDFARIGSGSRILPDLKLGRFCKIGAGSIVTKDIPERAIVVGAPAKVVGYQDDSEIEEYRRSVMKWVERKKDSVKQP